MTEITLLDGSIGQELVRRSGDRATPLWSTQVMMERPELVAEVHGDYFAAGATIATANTYALHRSRLERVGLQDHLPELIDTALTQAESARAAAGGGRIAGSLGPLLASYRPDLHPDVAEARTRYREVAGMMAGRVDLFIIETVSSVQEAQGALSGTQGCGKPVWLALSVMDDDGTRLRSGEHLGDIAATVARFDPEAVLINCTRPESVAAALDILRGLGRPFGAYANAFTRISDGFLKNAPTVDALQRRSDMDPEKYAGFALGWIEQGATIVGGCCEVGPDHIAELARQLRAAGHRIT